MLLYHDCLPADILPLNLKKRNIKQFLKNALSNYTYRYCLEPTVCSCKATENPNKLPLVFPSLITGNRSSILNPVQVCVQWHTAKTAQSKSLSDMFPLFSPLLGALSSRRSTISERAWGPSGNSAAMSSNR